MTNESLSLIYVPVTLTEKWTHFGQQCHYMHGYTPITCNKPVKENNCFSTFILKWPEK